MILLGFDKQCITPNLPVALSGYAGKRIATEVHDDIYTRCIAMEDGDKKFLLAQCDCIAIDDGLRQDVLKKLNNTQINIDNAHLVLVAAHTHSGPAGTLDTSKPPFQGLQNVFGEPDPEYRKYLTEQIVLAAKNAFSDMTTASLTIARGTVEGVGTERHDPSKPGDTSLLTLLFEREDGKRILLYNYACHPTVLSPANLLLTADLPYGVEQELKNTYDMILFVNSCCGDISTRFTRKSSSYEQIDIYSRIIVQSIQTSLQTPLYHGSFNQLEMMQHPITLPAKQLGSIEDETRQLTHYQIQLSQGRAQGLPEKELRILESYVEGALISVELARTLQGFESLNTHFSIIRLQGLKIAVIPGELFSALGRKLKENNIDVFCYGNGYYLYFADKEAYDLAYYEAMSSPFERGVGEFLIDQIFQKALEIL